MKKNIGKYLKWIIFSVSVIVLIVIIKNVLDKGVLTIDIEGYKMITSVLMSEPMTQILRIVTHLGGEIWLIVLTGILFFTIKNRKIALSVLINLCLAASTNFILKNIVQRPRPEGYRLIDEIGYSLPSGHSMIGLAVYGFLVYLIYKNIKNKKVKWSLIIGLSVLELIIGISRIYLGVHYTSDVLAGYSLGVAYLVVYITLAKKYILKENESQNT